MSRNRVRRSFTVETKARGRQAPAILPVRAPLLEPHAPAFPSLEAAALFGAEPGCPAGGGNAGRPAPRRILPSLIELPVPEPEEAEPVMREQRLPRVRRVKPLRGEPAAIEAEPASVIPALSQAAETSAPKTAPPEPTRAVRAAEPVRRAARRAEKALPLGERWKRRLPRVCW
jgi:hypothetical protein